MRRGGAHGTVFEEEFREHHDRRRKPTYNNRVALPPQLLDDLVADLGFDVHVAVRTALWYAEPPDVERHLRILWVSDERHKMR